ncbi:hemin ABC transporter substrate-binding protein [Billgrantia tianxiuensis]|uniref:Hemin ABC transporter substrate-binding protein n=1 Tax=Billgrantia tianxiuensis TaxID=2497861 RepID=A0A6I6SJX8_9GAMM|nr:MULTISPECIES: ABC transporter substrate-binding protein [Halomonas]MCE8034284.1 ABC transporter substrate-binding protein [Halomonas sp. MCCC 1A11057]QHC50909.1 hemin ABC transporter substrate-binding protein [Halomonas tianxiuensis]
MKRWRCLLLGLGAGLLLGYQVALAEAPRTVVIGSDVAEILAMLDALEGVVGRDDTSQYPERVAALPSVGYLRQLAAEGILSLAPERLIVGAAAGPREVLAQLEAVGVEVVRIEQGANLAALPAKIRAVASAIGRDDAGDALVSEIEAKFATLEAQRQTTQGPGPSAMFLLSHSGMTPMAAGRDTAGQAVIEAAGARNAFASFNGYKAVGAEALVNVAPEVVIATRSGLEGIGGEAQLWQLPGLAMTPAGHARNLVVCDDQALLGFGPRTPTTLMALHSALRSAVTDTTNEEGCWRVTS